jgi:hypothetical protein
MTLQFAALAAAYMPTAYQIKLGSMTITGAFPNTLISNERDWNRQPTHCASTLSPP